MSYESWGDDSESMMSDRDVARCEEAFTDGLQAMREMLARFVEQGGDTITAASIRANWHPEWGDDPGRLDGPLPIDPWGSAASTPATDHPAPTDAPAPACECGARLNLKGQTRCAECIDRMTVSPPPSPGEYVIVKAGEPGEVERGTVELPPDPPRRSAEQADPLEAAYWRFDSLRKRKGMPMAERDAFKSACRWLLEVRGVDVTPPSPGGEDVGALLASHLAVVESMPPGDWPCDRCRAPCSRHIDSGHEFYSREQRRAWTKQMSDSIIALAGEVERLTATAADLRDRLAKCEAGSERVRSLVQQAVYDAGGFLGTEESLWHAVARIARERDEARAALADARREAMEEALAAIRACRWPIPAGIDVPSITANGALDAAERAVRTLAAKGG